MNSAHVQVSLRAARRRTGSAAQVRAVEVGAGDVGADEGRALEVGPAERRATEDGAVEAGA